MCSGTVRLPTGLRLGIGGGVLNRNLFVGVGGIEDGGRVFCEIDWHGGRFRRSRGGCTSVEVVSMQHYRLWVLQNKTVEHRPEERAASTGLQVGSCARSVGSAQTNERNIVGLRNTSS